MMQQKSVVRSNKKIVLFSLVLALVLLAISVVLNLALAVQLRAASAKVLKSESEANLRPGDRVPDLEALNLDGGLATFSFSSGSDTRPTVIYVFSPSCGWCEKNLDNIKELTESESQNFRFVGVSLSNDGLTEYVRKQKWNFSVLKDVTASTRSLYKLGGTPQTIVVSGDGVVLKNWRGAYMLHLKDDVESYFGVSLPGIRSD